MTTTALFPGSFLERIEEIAESGEFVVMTNPVTQDETVICEMTTGEKAFFTYLKERSREKRRNPVIIGLSREELRDLKEFHMAGNLFWFLVRHRLQEKYPDVDDSTNLAVREGLVLVAVPTDVDDEHDCERCEDRETCQLKQAIKYRAERA